MSAPEKISKVDRLRMRDGDRCWLCNAPLEFGAVPNSSKAWSVEHLADPELPRGPRYARQPRAVSPALQSHFAGPAAGRQDQAARASTPKNVDGFATLAVT
jgi:hypothetical protein